MFDSIRNIFSIPELRKTGHLHPAAAGHLPGRRADPEPGHQRPPPWPSSGRPRRGRSWASSTCSPGQLHVPDDDLRPGHHALHQRLDHPPAPAVVWPYLERLSKEGELGRKKITQYTRYGTIVICFIQAWGIALFLQGLKSPGGARIVPNPGPAASSS